jgi:hypothetical protein
MINLNPTCSQPCFTVVIAFVVGAELNTQRGMHRVNFGTLHRTRPDKAGAF